MRIIKTAQFEQHEADPSLADVAGLNEETPSHAELGLGDESDLGGLDVQGLDGLGDLGAGAGLGHPDSNPGQGDGLMNDLQDLSADLGGLGQGDDVDLDFDLNVGDHELQIQTPEDGGGDFGGEAPADLPVDVQLDGQDVTMNGQGGHGQFDEMSLDGNLDGHMDVGDLHNTGGAPELEHDHEAEMAQLDQPLGGHGHEDGLDGLMVIE